MWIKVDYSQPPRIEPVERVVVDVGVEVHAVDVAEGVGLEEAAEGGAVDAGAVVVEAGFDIQPAGGEQDGVAAGRSRQRTIVSIAPNAVRSRRENRCPAKGVIVAAFNNLHGAAIKF